jgi:hypothetical protein
LNIEINSAACPSEAGTPLAQSPQARADLLATLLDVLNTEHVSYCLLSGYRLGSGDASSDVDLMVHPREVRRLPRLMHVAAGNAGASLVQAIRHETAACYFVLARQTGSTVSFLNPDVSADYRTRGRLWLRSREVTGKRRPFNNFFLPAVEDQFIYYLIKKVVKQKIEYSHVLRLRNLYRASPFACRERMLKFWNDHAACAIEQALIRLDLNWLESHLPALLRTLSESERRETIGHRLANRLLDVARALTRIAYPTGMSVQIRGDDQQICNALADTLVHTLAPAFRQACTDQLDDSAVKPNGDNQRGEAFRFRLRFAVSDCWRLRLARMQSTLVVSTRGSNRESRRKDVSHAATSFLGAFFLSPLEMLLSPVDLSFVLTPGGAPGRGIAFPALSALTNRAIFLNSDLSLAENAGYAAEAILRWLAARQAKRLGIFARRQGEPPGIVQALPAEDAVGAAEGD